MTRPGSDPTKTNGTTAARSTSLAVAIVGVLAALLVLAMIGTFAAGTALVGPAVAGDQYATLTPTPYTVDAEPGEKFTVEVLLYTEGGHDGEGVSEVELVAQYHPDVLEITDIERGPWLEQGEEATIESEQVLAHEAGTAIFDQWREPAGDGATGHGELVTMTVAVPADAPDVETAISFDETRIDLIRDWPLPLDADAVEVTVGDGDGAGDADDTDSENAIAPFDHPDPAEIDTESADSSVDADATGENDADEHTVDTETDDQPNDDATTATDSVPGFSGLLTGLLLVGGVLVRALTRRHTV
ncbi:hypothetical protein C483_12568 [Natrialba hulunbeirensis JCM 10989]|uniref:Cohesin domain-containing protein n=1 Tax=Natrialba hulunbeirensis JCM 10989 TaxID=1227493 RepID=L9ZVH7_9EURY|nr:hypothetical protein [Natrialba hulunbeirensis]ELY90344.1 hypothetical protein C483_12568 [Natrialba hulunbeirensis JCM 10989]